MFFFIPVIWVSCIQEAPLNPEADILTFTFPSEYLRLEKSDVYNNYILTYPKQGVDLTHIQASITLTPGATMERIEKAIPNDTIYYIKVTSEDKLHSKLYAITQLLPFPDAFTFDDWVKYSNDYLYKNPRDKGFQWFSSNNGAATAFANKNRPADDFPVRQIEGRNGAGNAAKMVTMEGPGSIAGGIKYIPCLAGSLYLGGFSLMNALFDPLSSTLFGVPFDNGKPEKLTGYYKYIEGEGPYISVGAKNTSKKEPDRKDYCAIYAVFFEIDSRVSFLDGNTIASSPNIVAKAQISEEERAPTPGTDYHFFEADFIYRKAFDWDKLRDNKYKMTIVFSSASKGDYYEGRIGNTLIVDDVKIICRQQNSEE